MKCPRCVQRIHRAAISCPHCGFSIADADLLFKDVGVKLSLLMDEAGLFRRNERDLLEDALDGFIRTFPQLFFAVYTGTPNDDGDLRQFGFWLLNRGHFVDIPKDRQNSAGILLVIDPERKSAGISFGYMLDSFLEEEDTFECLSRAHAYWLQGKYAEGVLRCVQQLKGLLKSRSRQARRTVKKYKRNGSIPAAMETLTAHKRNTYEDERLLDKEVER